MKIKYKLALTLFTGVAIGLALGTAIHAQQTKVPPAYIVAEPVVSDPATFQKYDSRFQGPWSRSVAISLFAVAKSKLWRATPRSAS